MSGRVRIVRGVVPPALPEPGKCVTVEEAAELGEEPTVVWEIEGVPRLALIGAAPTPEGIALIEQGARQNGIELKRVR